jgi:Flp pilus assembly protein TadB
MMIAAALSSFTMLLLASSRRRESSRPLINLSETPQRAVLETKHRRRRLVITLGAVTLTLILDPALAVVLGIGVLGWPRVRRILRQRAERAAIDAALPDAIEMLILIVRAGMTPHQAVTMLTERAPLPVRPAFVEVDRRRARGATLADALRALPDLVGPGANVVADTLAMAERYGTPITEALEQLSVDVRERRVRQAEADARRLPIRMSFPLVVCTLPSFVLIAIVPAVLGALSSLDGNGF